MIESPGSAATRTLAAPATTVEQALTLAGVVWMTLGLFVDGYAHQNIIDTATEDFFTPWHGLFYSGFVATAAWFLVIAFRRPHVDRFVDRFPAGYRLGAVGLVLFAAGGIADGAWHTAFGVEVSIDALLSPTHLLLLVGGFLLLSTPLRAAWAAGGDAPGGRLFAIVSMALCTSLLSFFFTYAWGLSENDWIAVRYIPATDQGYAAIAQGVPASLLSTVVLVIPMILLLRRWRLPFGATAALWTAVAFLEATAFHNNGPAVPAALAGGIAFDLALRSPSLPWRWQVRTAAFAGPVAMWSLWIWLSRRSPGIAMPFEIWSGLILFAGLAGFALALIGFPPPPPEAAGIDHESHSLGSAPPAS